MACKGVSAAIGEDSRKVIGLALAAAPGLSHLSGPGTQMLYNCRTVAHRINSLGSNNGLPQAGFMLSPLLRPRGRIIFEQNDSP